jgi:hypothetical protein
MTGDIEITDCVTTIAVLVEMEDKMEDIMIKAGASFFFTA